jgi:hypothetical protein
VQGEVVSTTCIKHDEKIYTENVLRIEQVLSGDITPKEVTILTRGGEIDDVRQFESHGFSLRKGDKGYFFLKEKQSSWGGAYYEVYAGRQGFYQKRHDGFMTTLNSSIKSYPSFNSFCKNFGFAYDEVEFEEEMRAMNNPDACLKYRLEQVETTDFSGSNQIVFNMYVRSTETVSLSELSIQLNYSTNWFGQNIVANNKLILSDGDFDESYILQALDVSSDVLEVNLGSSSAIGQLQLLSGSEIKAATVSIVYEETESELPIVLENTVYSSRYYDEDENLVTNNCGHIEFGATGCGIIILGINSRKAAGDQTILTISGSGFTHPSAQPGDEWCGLPNIEHRVKFKSLVGESISPLEGDYISWTNTEIQVKVPTTGYINDSFILSNTDDDEIAGTFNIKVCIDDTDMQKCVCFDESGFNDNPNDGILYVPFAARTLTENEEPDPTLGECNFSDHARLVSDLSNGLFFYIEELTAEQQDAFIRALNTWICETGIDYEIEPAPFPGTIPVEFVDFLPDGLLGLTVSTRPDCITDDLFFTQKTLGIFFNDKVVFNFDNNTPTKATEFDFESTALHELGHAMGLLHTCNINNVMWPFGEEGDDSKRVLTLDDIEGGKYCQVRSTIDTGTGTNCRELGTGFKSTVGANNLKDSKFFSIVLSPNPTHDQIKIDFLDATLTDVTVKLYNANSSLVLTKDISENNASLNLTTFDNGVYFIVFEADGVVVHVDKVIKL